jgi:arylsulfatase A-like enzyme
VLVTATSGEATTGLGDPAVRVPLVVHLPGAAGRYVVRRRVPAQVRLMDVTPTILDALGLDPLPQAEGVDLGGYGEGVRERTMWTSLVGRRDDGGFLVGLRNNGVKYVKDLTTGAEALYDLTTDPGETRDLKDEQATTLGGARLLLAPEEKALEGLLRR